LPAEEPEEEREGEEYVLVLRGFPPKPEPPEEPEPLEVLEPPEVFFPVPGPEEELGSEKKMMMSNKIAPAAIIPIIIAGSCFFFRETETEEAGFAGPEVITGPEPEATIGGVCGGAFPAVVKIGGAEVGGKIGEAPAAELPAGALLSRKARNFSS